MLDAIRHGLVKKEQAVIPSDPEERTRHLKSFAYYQDASQVGVCELSTEMFLRQSLQNPDIEELAEDLRSRQTKTLAAGIDVVMTELKESMEAPTLSCKHHTHALVFLYEYPRDPGSNEPGCDWLQNSQAQRAALLAAETSTVISNYIRLLGFEARGHTASASDINLAKATVAAGLGRLVQNTGGVEVRNSYLGTRYGVGVVTTTLRLTADLPLAKPNSTGYLRSHGTAWWLGHGIKSKGFARNAFNQQRYNNRQFKDGLYPFEKTPRVSDTTTYIDESRVPRVPKRTDMFARGSIRRYG